VKTAIKPCPESRLVGGAIVQQPGATRDDSQRQQDAERPGRRSASVQSAGRDEEQDRQHGSRRGGQVRRQFFSLRNVFLLPVRTELLHDDGQQKRSADPLQSRDGVHHRAALVDRVRPAGRYDGRFRRTRGGVRNDRHEFDRRSGAVDRRRVERDRGERSGRGEDARGRTATGAGEYKAERARVGPQSRPATGARSDFAFPIE
jgi:hypothetical protein